MRELVIMAVVGACVSAYAWWRMTLYNARTPEDRECARVGHQPRVELGEHHGLIKVCARCGRTLGEW